MKFEVDTDTVLQIVQDRMLENLAANAKAQGLSDEEVDATVVLNKKKIEKDAQNLAVFFTSLYVTENTEDQLPL
jgi:ribosome-binding factor A